MFLLLQVLSIKGLGSLSFAKSIPCNEMFGSTLHANQSFNMCYYSFKKYFPDSDWLKAHA